MLVLKISDIATISVCLIRQPSKFIFNHEMKEHNRMEDFFFFLIQSGDSNVWSFSFLRRGGLWG